MPFVLGVSYKNSLTVSWLVDIYMALFSFPTFHWRNSGNYWFVCAVENRQSVKLSGIRRYGLPNPSGQGRIQILRECLSVPIQSVVSNLYLTHRLAMI